MVVRTFSGTRLRQLRTSRRLTQHDLASRLRTHGFGTTQTTISRWEDGQQPLASVIPALASELGCEIGELYGDEDDEEAASMPLTRAEQEMFFALLARAVSTGGIAGEAVNR